MDLAQMAGWLAAAAAIIAMLQKPPFTVSVNNSDLKVIMK